MPWTADSEAVARRPERPSAGRSIGRLVIWILAAFGGLTAAFLIGGIVALSQVDLRQDTAEVPSEAVLWLDLNQPIARKPAGGGFLNKPSGPVLLDYVAALERARTDDRIKGVVAEIGNIPLGMAETQELRYAIQTFRESGKFTVIFSEDFGGMGNGTTPYYLASVFDEIWLQPSGSVGLTGVALEIPYFREALEKMDITPRFEQRHEYKGGADPFTESLMTGPARESLQGLANGWLTQVVVGVEEGRPALSGKVQGLVDTAPHLGGEALSQGLVDRLGYWDEFEAAVEDRAGADFEWMSVAAYSEAARAEWSGNSDQGGRVAIVYGIGVIEPNGGDNGPLRGDRGFGPYRIASTLSDIRESGDYDAVLLRVDSPGGAYAQSDMVWREVHLLREAGIPVVVTMGDMAASGGYFVSMAADHVIAQPGTLTGSIGVYSGKFVTERLWTRLGVNWERVQAGENAGLWSMVRDFTPAEMKKFRRSVDFVYDDFSGKAAQDRGLDAQQIDRAARGRIWTGQQALEVGLVDELGGFPQAAQALRGLLSLPEEAALNYEVLPKAPSALEQLEALMEAEDPFAWLSASAIEKPVMEKVDRLTNGVIGKLPMAGMVQLPPIIFN